MSAADTQKPDSPVADIAAGATPAATDDAPAAATAPEDEAAALRREVEVWRDKHLRAIADARNAQQRAARDKEEAIRYAEFGLARELLPVIDGMERALKAATSSQGNPVVDGVRIVYDQLLKVLRDHGVSPIAAAGQRFDPGRHEALLQQASTSVAAGDVVEEVERGYMMNERVLRCARVIVSSGPAQPAE